MGDLSENFSSIEFACRCGCGYATPSHKLVGKLQELRDKWGFAITVRSGCRCPDHNRSDLVFGARNSYHLNGMGADVTPKDIELVAQEKSWARDKIMNEFHKLAKSIFDGNGIIYYPVKKFVHVDVRGYRYMPIPVV